MRVGCTTQMTHIVREIKHVPPNRWAPAGYDVYRWYCNNQAFSTRSWLFSVPVPVGCQRCIDGWRARVRALRRKIGLDSWGDLDKLEAACEGILEFAVQQGLSDQIERVWA